MDTIPLAPDPFRAAEPRAAGSSETERDVRAAIAAHRELGPDYDEAVASRLAERVEELAAARSTELQRLADGESGAERSARNQRFALGVVSVVMAVPVTAIGANLAEPGLLGMVASWAGLVGLNVVHARSQRRR